MSENIQYNQVVTQKQSGLGIAGMVIGIIALLLACLVFGGFLGIIGIILSIVGACQKDRKHGTAIAGIVLNAIAIIIMIIMFAVAASSANESETNSNIVSNKIESEASSGNESESTIEEDSHMPTVGEYVEGETWKISLLDAKEYDQITGNAYSDKPDEGNNYLVLFFEVENVSDEDDYFNYFYIESYLDGYSTNISYVLNDPEGYEMLSGDVAAGKKLKGCLTYQVPSSGWSELEVSYKDWIGTSNKVATFVVTPDNLTE